MSRDHDELSPSTRALLDAARLGLGPSPDAIARMRANVTLAVAGVATIAVTAPSATAATVVAAPAAPVAGVAAGSVAPVASAATGLATVKSAIALKLAALGVVAGAAVGGVTTPPPAVTVIDAPARVATVPARSPERAGSARPGARAEARAVPPAPTPPVEMPADPVVANAVPPAADELELITLEAAPARPAVKVARRAPPTLAREVELVDAAVAAVRRGEHASALSTLRRYAAETRGAGQLAEDAAVIEIEALCRLGDPRANARLTAFDARFPSSAQRARLAQVCP